MPTTHTVTLPEGLAQRLTSLAKAAKRSEDDFIREALECFLDDLDDARLAETAYEDFLKSGEAAVPLEELERRLGLAD